MKVIPCKGVRGRLTPVIVDDDFTMPDGWKMYAHTNRYITLVKHFTKGGRHRRTVKYLHRYVIGCPDGMVVDHINFDVRDNRRENLRICTSAQNVRRRHINGFHPTPGGKYVVQMAINGVRCSLGTYNRKSDARNAYIAVSAAMLDPFKPVVRNLK